MVLPCFVCFCVESDEEFVGQCDTDDHFRFALIDEALPKCCEGLIEFSGNICDEEQDGSHMGTPAFCASVALPPSTIIGERCEACKF